MLGCFLEMAGIDYVILESQLSEGIPRSPIVLGSFGMNLLNEVGLAEETLENSCHMTAMRFWRASATECEARGHLDFTNAESRFAFNGRSIECATLQQILLNRLPRERVLDKQKVVQVTQTPHRVDVKCSDNSIHTGSILVGADGYDSIVRRLLYEGMVNQPPDLLAPSSAMTETQGPPLPPPSDLEPLDTRCCISGSTCDLDPQEGLFPDFFQMNPDESDTHVVTGADVPFSWWMTRHPRSKRVNWLIVYDKDRDSSAWHGSHPYRDDIGRPDMLQDFLEQMGPLKTPFGGSGTLGHLIDRTDPQSIRSYKRCEKLFQTWYHGRVVLMGDGNNMWKYGNMEMVPFTGQGTLQAMLDACQLSLAIRRIHQSHEPPEVAIAEEFHAYYYSRLEYAQVAVDSSREFANFVGHPGFDPQQLQDAQFDFVPAWLTELAQANLAAMSQQ
ncbi:hypothetical protein BGW42_004455 [Actinomortierella wolfii]|nr:hypothetical protein BGW42_004455 [Actinomortierella wolfii]